MAIIKVFLNAMDWISKSVGYYPYEKTKLGLRKQTNFLSPQIRLDGSRVLRTVAAAASGFSKVSFTSVSSPKA